MQANNQQFSPANYLATYIVEEFGYSQARQQHIDLFEEKISSIAAEQSISLDTIPDASQIESLFSNVHAYIDLDEVLSV